jgi:hypothetical protein
MADDNQRRRRPTAQLEQSSQCCCPRRASHQVASGRHLWPTAGGQHHDDDVVRYCQSGTLAGRRTYAKWRALHGKCRRRSVSNLCVARPARKMDNDKQTISARINSIWPPLTGWNVSRPARALVQYQPIARLISVWPAGQLGELAARLRVCLCASLSGCLSVSLSVWLASRPTDRRQTASGASQPTSQLLALDDECASCSPADEPGRRPKPARQRALHSDWLATSSDGPRRCQCAAFARASRPAPSSGAGGRPRQMSKMSTRTLAAPNTQ